MKNFSLAIVTFASARGKITTFKEKKLHNK
jgi:hypothetical protein